MFGIFPPEKFFCEIDFPHSEEYKADLILARLSFKEGALYPRLFTAS
jgi:hypothetical protein